MAFRQISTWCHSRTRSKMTRSGTSSTTCDQSRKNELVPSSTSLLHEATKFTKTTKQLTSYHRGLFRVLRVLCAFVRKSRSALPGYLDKGSGLTWNFTSLLVVPLPPSEWNGARVA